MAVAITRPGGDIAGVAASGNVATYTDTNIGTAADDRIVVVCVGTELANSVPTACTIQGITATAGVAATQGAVNSHIFYARVPSGTTATVAVTFGGTNPTAAQNHIAVYRVVGGGLPRFAASSVADTDADPITTGSQTIPTSGGGIFICADATDTTARTWTGAAEDLDVDAGDFRFSTGTSTTAGALTTTVSGGNNEDGAISWVFFGLDNTLTPSLFTDDDTFFTQTVTPGAVDLAPSLYADDDTFHQPTVVSTYDLAPSLYDDGDTFFSPTVEQSGAGSQDLQPALYTDDDTFFTPTVIPGAVDLAPSLYSDGDTFHSPTVSATYDLAPSLYSDADEFFTPTVSATYDLAPSLYSDADSFHSPTVSAIHDLAPSLYSDGDTFFTPTVTPGAVDLAPSLYTDDDTFFSPIVSLEGGPQTLLPSLYSDADTFHSPTVAATYALSPSLYIDDDTFFSPTVSPGAVDLAPELFVDSDVFFSPTMSGGDTASPIVPVPVGDGSSPLSRAASPPAAAREAQQPATVRSASSPATPRAN